MTKIVSRLSVDADLAAVIEQGKRLRDDFRRAVLSLRNDPFHYGWCRTDHKSGQRLRREFRDDDYVFDEPYATRTRAMLDKLGLPMPKAGQVFRGTNHDMIFLNSHGVVVRIGPTDVEDLANPAIVQPLGWLEDREKMINHGGQPVPFSVVIYPGIELNRHFYDAHGLEGDCYSFMRRSEQATGDIGVDNQGIVHVADEDGTSKTMRVLLDSDNVYNRSSYFLARRRQDAADLLGTTLIAAGARRDAVIDNVLRHVFNNASVLWHKVFEKHLPLRQLFWAGLDSPDAAAALPGGPGLDHFWSACAAAVKRPLSLTVPVWRSEVASDGQTKISCVPLTVDVTLRRPWTGYRADREGGFHLRDILRGMVNSIDGATRIVAIEAIAQSSRVVKKGLTTLKNISS